MPCAFEPKHDRNVYTSWRTALLCWQPAPWPPRMPQLHSCASVLAELAPPPGLLPLAPPLPQPQPALPPALTFAPLQAPWLPQQVPLALCGTRARKGHKEKVHARGWGASGRVRARARGGGGKHLQACQRGVECQGWEWHRSLPGASNAFQPSITARAAALTSLSASFFAKRFTTLPIPDDFRACSSTVPTRVSQSSAVFPAVWDR